MRTNKFYIHIGLHKTATTSLQSAIFPELNQIHFIGRTNPRSKTNNDQLYKQIVKFCFSNTRNNGKEAHIIDLLAKRITVGSFLMSEEWFTADYSEYYKFNGCQWQEKLKRLSDLVTDMDYKILLSLRNPIELLFSQYGEFVHRGIQKRYNTFTEYLYNSNDAKAIDYPYLSALINSYFPKDNVITLIKYEDMLNNPEKYKKNLSNWLGQIISSDISWDNKTIKNENHIQVKSYSKKQNAVNFILSNIPKSTILLRNQMLKKAYHHIRGNKEIIRLTFLKSSELSRAEQYLEGSIGFWAKL